MKIVEAGVSFFRDVDGQDILKRIEEAARVCYKSEAKIYEGSADKFVRDIIKRGHESVLEHCSFSLRFICDRGVSHEIVRHRLASYSQESTRYCNYSKDGFCNEITVIKPVCIQEEGWTYAIWKTGCENAEKSYFDMLRWGGSPQEARSVLPNSLKTEIIMTANIREWRHFFKLRCARSAHPDMRSLATKALLLVKEKIPILFDDIEY